MRIYLASNFASQDRMRGVREALQVMGHRITSTWLDEDGAQSYELYPDRGPVYALRDREEIEYSDLLVIDTLEPSNTGGREVEFGLALGRQVQVWRVGPARNVFHTIINRTYATWEECYADLRRRGNSGRFSR